MKTGKLITVEGPDGAGKSTQLNFIKKYLEDKNIKYIFLREPGGTHIGERIRELLLDKSNGNMSFKAEMLLYAAARAQLVEEKIKPALNMGKIVVCDRYIDSSFAYQGYGRELGEIVWTVNEYAIEGLMPDLTIFLSVDAKRTFDRISTGERNEEKDRIELESMDFHERVFYGYKKISEVYRERFKNIDGTKSIEEVSRDIKRELDKVCGS